jgi:hypothetical protein
MVVQFLAVLFVQVTRTILGNYHVVATMTPLGQPFKPLNHHERQTNDVEVAHRGLHWL